MEQILNQIEYLLGPELFQLIMNPRTNRPIEFRYFKRKKSFKNLSGGEKVLVLLAYDLYNETGNMNINDLFNLDENGRVRALNSLQRFLQVTPI